MRRLQPHEALLVIETMRTIFWAMVGSGLVVLANHFFFDPKRDCPVAAPAKPQVHILT